MEPAGAHRGRLVTFYSYKGGTGRSMALANVAWVLACSGRRVLVIDWDLEAPGLHRYFAPFLADPDLKETDGLIDFVWDFTTQALTPGIEGDAKWFVPLADFKRFATSLEYDFPSGGAIDFVPAGCQGGDYADRVSSFDWKRFYEGMGGGVFLETAASRAREDYDYVFLDSRTGVSDISGICTIHLPDLLIVCFTANNQSIKGTAAIAESVREQWAADPERSGAPPRIYPLLTRVDVFERDRLDRRRELARTEFVKLLRGSEGLMELPYIPIYSYEENLAAFRDRPEDKEAVLLPGIERLTSLITDGKVSRLESPPKEVQRRRTLARFEGRDGAELEAATKVVEASRYDVFISHSASDRPAVEEISRRLIERGIRPFLDTLQLRPGEVLPAQVEAALDASLSAAIFIGPSGLGPWQTHELRFALERRPAEGILRIIPVFLPGADPDAVTLPTALRALSFVDFRRSLNEEAALDRLVAGIRGTSPSLSSAETSVENPYRGLKSFDNASARFFFGREELVARLLASLQLSLQNDERLLFLVGASGSGKSSILFAGLIPRLTQGAVQGSDKWLVATSRPGSEPLYNLARSLIEVNSTGLESPVDDAQFKEAAASSSDDPTTLDRLAREALTSSSNKTRLLLVVDHFEDLFRLPDSQARKAFIENVRHATGTKNGPVVVVISLRSDFYDECLTYPALAASLEKYCTVVGPLTDAELREAIERPAQSVGCEFEPGLVELLLNDARGQTASLPLIQATLAELWTHREGRRLTVASYEHIGGLPGFLARRASEVLSSMDEGERSLCRRIFLRLVNPGEGTVDTKIRVPVSELMLLNEPSEAISAVIRKLAEARLVSLGRDSSGIETVEIAHESLIQSWDVLRSWIENSRSALRARARLTVAARDWNRSENDASYLYSGSQLTSVRNAIEIYRDDLTYLEEDFLAASESLAARETPTSRFQILLLWWTIRDLYHQLKPCRFSLLVALVACPVFLSIAQGTEILRTVGEGMAGNQWYWPRVSGFFAALLLWALSSWYAARVLLYLDFPGERARSHSRFAEVHTPRLLGIAPILIVGAGFLGAAQPYTSASPARFWLYFFAGICFVLAGLFYALLVLRRKLIGETYGKVSHFSELDGATVRAVGTMLISSLLLFILFAIDPVSLPQWVGMGTILFLAAASWVSAGSLLVYFSGRWQFPVIACFVGVAVIYSRFNDNHVIRTVPAQVVNRLDLVQSFHAWYDQVKKDDGAGARHPLFIVASEGGGIRAAYWTATVLGGIQDADRRFASHLFAISGVSGGSLGAVVFDALLAEPNPESFKFKDKAEDILGQDFLSPALASMLYPDFVQRFLFFPVSHFDRGRALELGWEKGWRNTMGNNRFADSFVDLWKPTTREWMPALFLNGTSVEKGNRIITTNLRLTNAFLDAEDAANKLATGNLPPTRIACHIPLSTAANMSARFTYVSPAGRFPDGSRVVDGGYFENSGATTALEIAVRIKDACAAGKIDDVDVKVIMISNDPRKGSLILPRVRESPDQSQAVQSEAVVEEDEYRDDLTEQSSPSEPVTTDGEFLGDLTAPLYALLNTRNARGTYAQKAIAREQRRFKAAQTSSAKDIVYFGLGDAEVPLPLGWMLSAAAAKTMQNQLWQNDDVVRNGVAMDEILQILSTTGPR